MPLLTIPDHLRLTANRLVIRPTTYGQLAALNHPLWRDEPPAAYRPRFHYFVVEREDDGAIVSSLDIEEVDDGSGTLSMTWATIPVEQRKGYASRSARRLIEWLFQQPRINQIEIDIASENEAKISTAQSLGGVQADRQARSLAVTASLTKSRDTTSRRAAWLVGRISSTFVTYLTPLTGSMAAARMIAQIPAAA